MKTIIMTGATSFLGRNLLNWLLDNDYKVYALVRAESENFSKLPKRDNLYLLYGDLENIKVIKDRVKEADCFIHFAWDGSGYKGRADKKVQNKNVQYSMDAIQVANELNCEKFIFSGSQAEYGKKYSEIKESDECFPISEYGKAKLEFSKKAHEYCKNKSMKFLHLRIFSVYGYGDRNGSLVDLCVSNFIKDKNVELGPCLQNWNFLYIHDFTDIISKMLKSEIETGIYNIASKDTRQLREFVKEIYRLSDERGNYYFGDVASNPEGSPSLMPNIDKITKVLGNIQFTEFEIGIRKLIEMKKKEG